MLIIVLLGWGFDKSFFLFMKVERPFYVLRLHVYNRLTLSAIKSRYSINFHRNFTWPGSLEKERNYLRFHYKNKSG